MRLAAAWAGAVLWVTTNVLRTSGEGAMVKWRRVMVESSWIHSRAALNMGNLSLTLCGSTCMRTNRCRLWCLTQPGRCQLSPIIVSGSYQPSQPDGALLCYTSRSLDFAAQASITSTGDRNEEKAKENLVDGVYNLFSSGTAIAKCGEESCWFLVDLGTERVISEVLLMAHHNEGNRVNRFRDIEVKVGDVALNFSSYTLLGTFEGPAEPSQEVVLRPPSPLTGRYVLILKTSVNQYFQVAHLEIR